MHPKVQSKHLQKIAYLYLRQSSPKQLIDHKESLPVQLGLKDKLYELGFPNVEVIDCDLGKSAAGYADREGFTTIVNNVCSERAGAVASWEASRLSRSHYEWQNLSRFCQITGTLIIDESGIYDPTNIDDIAMLGIKATMCEYELNILAKRARAGLEQKAKRGKLYTMLPSGYYLTEDEQYEIEPDERIQKTIMLLFDKFAELGSARQVLLWFRQEQVEFPKVNHQQGKREIVWQLPIYNTILGVLRNPAYAGAYAYGQSETRSFIREGQPVKTSGHPVAMEDWKVLIRNHHQGYINWEHFLENQHQLHENANKLIPSAKGAAKMGVSLLVGLISCAHCGRKLLAKYSGHNGKSVRYICRGGVATTGQTDKCFSTSARKLEQAVVQEVLKTIQPAAITAAIAAEKKLACECSESQKRIELALEQARYEAERRERQFNGTEPENRLVMREIEAHWNQALAKVELLQQELQKEKQNQKPLDDSELQRLYTLADDLPQLWNLSSTDERTKKRIIRTLIEGIIAEAEDNGEWNCFTIHWAGGVHSEIRLKRNKKGENGRKTSAEVIDLVKELAAITDDKNIARILNRCILKTATDQHWNQSRVKWLRKANQIPAFAKESAENSDNINLRQAAGILQISPPTVLRLIKYGLIKARQIVSPAPWIIKRTELEKKSVVDAVQSIKKNGKAIISTNQHQLTL